jgi:hypothetical protein
LPEPLEPMTTAKLPSASASETSASAVRSSAVPRWKVLETPRRLSVPAQSITLDESAGGTVTFHCAACLRLITVV